jgi:hypothetical protein
MMVARTYWGGWKGPGQQAHYTIDVDGEDLLLTACGKYVERVGWRSLAGELSAVCSECKAITTPRPIAA